MIDKSLRTSDIYGAQPKSYRESIDNLDESFLSRRIAGIKNYYSNIQPVTISETERFLENSSRGRKRRFHLPQNEIAKSNLFYGPVDEYYRQLNLSSKLEYNRSLQTDDIQGTKPGTFTNPSLKNLFRGKQIKNYQQFQEDSQKNKQMIEIPEISQNFHQVEQKQEKQPSEQTDQEINMLKARLNELQSQISSAIPSNQSQQVITAQNILSPKQYQQQIHSQSQDNNSIWGKMLAGKKMDYDNILKFGKGFKQLGYIYKNY